MSRNNDEIENVDFQDIFLALDRHTRYKRYSTSKLEASVPSSLLQEQLACFFLSGSPGQAPRLHRSGHGGQQGQAHIISLVKILAPDANHIIIPYSCARHNAKTSKIQQQITFSKPEP